MTMTERRQLKPILPNLVSMDSLSSYPSSYSNSRQTSPFPSYSAGNIHSTIVANKESSAEDPEKPKPRPLRSCSRCRQHKTRCDASVRAPLPCTHCAKKNAICELDLALPPQRSNILKKLTNQVNDLKDKVEFFLEKDHILRDNLTKIGLKLEISKQGYILNRLPLPLSPNSSDDETDDYKKKDSTTVSIFNSPEIHNESISPLPFQIGHSPETLINLEKVNESLNFYTTETDIEPDFYKIETISLSKEQIDGYFANYAANYHPFLPIFEEFQFSNPFKIYQPSKLLFWSIILTSSLSDSSPDLLYNKLCGLVKNLLIKSCWFETPRSTHIIHSLVILSTWPFPAHKLMDDLSTRMMGLARNVSLQLGLHRGTFTNEFSRGVIGKNVEYRTKLWKAVHINTSYLSSSYGLPCSVDQEDYIIGESTYKFPHFKKIPNGVNKRRKVEQLDEAGFYFETLLKTSFITSKIINLMGNSVTNTGLINYNERFINLGIYEQILNDLETDLKNAFPNGNLNSTYYKLIQIALFHARLQLYSFAFFPNTNIIDQKTYVNKTIDTCLKCCDLLISVISDKPLITQPIHVRFNLELVCYFMMRIQLSPLIDESKLDIVRSKIKILFDILEKSSSEWAEVPNDIKRTIRILKNFELSSMINPNFIVSQPYLISNMKTHLGASLFYEMIWFIHEIRRVGPSNSSTEKHINWADYGLSKELDSRLIEHLVNPSSLFYSNNIINSFIKNQHPVNENSNGLEMLIKGVEWVSKSVEDVLNKIGVNNGDMSG